MNNNSTTTAMKVFGDNKMKKAIALMLVVILMISLCACGGYEAGAPKVSTQSDAVTDETKVESKPEAGDEMQQETSAATNYAIGETFGTDSIEGVIDKVTWITSDIKSHPKTRVKIDVITNEPYYRLDMADLYPDYTFLGWNGISESQEGFPFLCVLLSLQNVGKKTIEFKGDPMNPLPYANLSVIYDDGYTFEPEFGIMDELEVLGDPVKIGRLISVKDIVFENKDKPLLIKVTLPNSAEEMEEFYVAIR